MTVRASITIDKNLWPQIGKRLSAKLARGLEPMSGQVTDALRDYFAEIFDTQGAAGGNGPWQTLSPETVRRWGQHPVLERTGTLWASLTQEGATGLTASGGASSRAFGYAVLSPDNKELTVGSWDPVQNFTEGGTRRIAARPIAPTTIAPHVIDKLEQIVADELTKDLEAL